jgi:hypothetical protein
MSKLPTRSPTHRDLDYDRLSRLGMDVEALAEDGPVTMDGLLELAAERGKPVSHLLAATALATEVEVAASAPIRLLACVGKCQQWGALDIVDRAVELWERRGGATAGFDVVPRSCLDRCDRAAACELRTPDGVAVLTEATADGVAEALHAALTP